MVKKGHYEDAIFPFQGISNESLLSLWCHYAITNKKVKCYSCRKRTKQGSPLAYCHECRNYFHPKCQKMNCNKDTPLPPDWLCSGCTMRALPFANIDDENMKLTSQGVCDDNIEFSVDKTPSFSIQSLLDQMPGQKIGSIYEQLNTF